MMNMLLLLVVTPPSIYQSETLSNYHVLDYPTYVLKPKVQDPGVKIPKWDPVSSGGVNMGFRNMHSTQLVYL